MLFKSSRIKAFWLLQDMLVATTLLAIMVVFALIITLPLVYIFSSSSETLVRKTRDVCYVKSGKSTSYAAINNSSAPVETDTWTVISYNKIADLIP